MEVAVLVADMDELRSVVVERGYVSVVVVEIPDIEEDIVTTKGNELDDSAIAGDEDETEIAEGT
jgi:hypothetical protein